MCLLPRLVMSLVCLAISNSVFSQSIDAVVGPTNDDAKPCYEDQYFDASEIISIDAERAEVSTPTGLPTEYSFVFRHYVDTQENTRALVEDGFRFDWNRQTLHYGDLTVELQQLLTNGERRRESGSQKIFLQQSDLVLNEQYSLDSQLGHFRSRSPNLVNSSYRFFLPTSIIQGGSALLHSNESSLRLTHGDIGNYEGTITNGFRRERGDLTGVAGEPSAKPRTFVRRATVAYR